MEDEHTIKWICGGVAAGLAAMYGFFIGHLYRHPEREGINEQLKDLWEKKQSVSSCEQIVKRIDLRADERHKATSDKLDRIMERLGI